MKDPVTWDSPVDHSSRLGRQCWKCKSQTSYICRVKWLSHWRWLIEDSDDVVVWKCRVLWEIRSPVTMYAVIEVHKCFKFMKAEVSP